MAIFSFQVRDTFFHQKNHKQKLSSSHNSKTAPEGTTWYNKFSEKQVSKQKNSQISPEVDDTADTNQIKNEKRPSATDL